MAIKKYIPIAATALLAPIQAKASLLPVCAETGNCGACDIVNVAITIAKWLITGAGGLALLIIVWAAFGLVASAGNPDKIQAAKKQIFGAILGMIITIAAFQLVMIMLFILVVPSRLQTYSATEPNNKESEEAVELGSLKHFLGIAWWNICNEAELRESDGRTPAEKNSTATCAFWGDGNVCGKDKVCCGWECKAAPCVPATGVQQYFESQYGADEKAVRDRLEPDVKIYKSQCIGSNTVNCANVAGLPEKTIQKLIEAANKCQTEGCIIITGGTEGGHKSHGPGLNVVDIAYSQDAVSALEAAGVTQANPNFPAGYTCEANGEASNCNNAQWLHVEF